MGCLILWAMLVGCSSSQSQGTAVSGGVSLDGVPLSSGVVIFEHQSSGAGMSAVIREGKFTFESPVPSGRYKVAVQEYQESSPLSESSDQNKKPVNIPNRYRETSSSQLTAEINRQAAPLVFELTTKESRP